MMILAHFSFHKIHSILLFIAQHYTQQSTRSCIKTILVNYHSFVCNLQTWYYKRKIHVKHRLKEWLETDLNDSKNVDKIIGDHM